MLNWVLIKGWANVKDGDILMAVEKAQGLKKGEKIKKMGPIQIKTRREPLNAITQHEVIREGFPDMTVDEFIIFFCKTHKRCTPETIIIRIEFKHL